MFDSARAKTVATIWFALLLLLSAGSGCCARAPRPGFLAHGLCGLIPWPGCGQQCAPVCVVDPFCYGYHATCWSPWPEQCGKCPTDPLRLLEPPPGTPAADQTDATEGRQADDVPTPPVAPDGTVDLELIPLPDSAPEGGKDAPVPPPTEGAGDVEPSPPAQPPPSSGEDDVEPPLEAPAEPPLEAPESETPQGRVQPIEAKIQLGAEREANRSRLRFVSFATPEVTRLGQPDRTFETGDGQVSQPGRDATGQHTDRNAGVSHGRVADSPAREERTELMILKALRLSFSPPAPRHPPAEAAPASPGS